MNVLIAIILYALNINVISEFKMYRMIIEIQIIFIHIYSLFHPENEINELYKYNNDTKYIFYNPLVLKISILIGDNCSY